MPGRGTGRCTACGLWEAASPLLPGCLSSRRPHFLWAPQPNQPTHTPVIRTATRTRAFRARHHQPTHPPSHTRLAPARRTTPTPAGCTPTWAPPSWRCSWCTARWACSWASPSNQLIRDAGSRLILTGPARVGWARRRRCQRCAERGFSPRRAAMKHETGPRRKLRPPRPQHCPFHSRHSCDSYTPSMHSMRWAHPALTARLAGTTICAVKSAAVRGAGVREGLIWLLPAAAGSTATWWISSPVFLQS